jgi:hypothetical protein
MNEQNCEQYTEWMSLAQDGMLNSTQTRLLHGHMSVCPPCQTTWEAMTFVSQMLHAAPMVAPTVGFAERVQRNLAYRQERRRRTVIGLLLSLGTLSLLIVTLPTVVNAVWLAGQMFLPYQIVAYGQGLVNLISVALSALGDAAWVILRFAATNATVQASLSLGAIAGAASVLWMRFVFRPRLPQRQTNR